MNMMMPISHRLYASAVIDGATSRRPASAERTVIIEVQPAPRRSAHQGPVCARAGEMELSSLWARARKYI